MTNERYDPADVYGELSTSDELSSAHLLVLVLELSGGSISPLTLISTSYEKNNRQ